MARREWLRAALAFVRVVGLLAVGLAGSLVVAGRVGRLSGPGGVASEVLGSTVALLLIGLVATRLTSGFRRLRWARLRALDARRRELNREQSDLDDKLHLLRFGLVDPASVKLDDRERLIRKQREVAVARVVSLLPGRARRQRAFAASALAASALGLGVAPYVSLVVHGARQPVAPLLMVGLVGACAWSLAACVALVRGQPMIRRRVSYVWPVEEPSRRTGRSWSPVYVVLLAALLVAYVASGRPPSAAGVLYGIGATLIMLAATLRASGLLLLPAVDRFELWWEERHLAWQQRARPSAGSRRCVACGTGSLVAALTATALSLVYASVELAGELLVLSIVLAALCTMLSSVHDLQAPRGSRTRRIKVAVDAVQDARIGVGSAAWLLATLGGVLLFVASRLS